MIPATIQQLTPEPFFKSICIHAPGLADVGAQAVELSSMLLFSGQRQKRMCAHSVAHGQQGQNGKHAPQSAHTEE